MQTLSTFRIATARPEMSGVVQHVFVIAAQPRPPIWPAPPQYRVAQGQVIDALPARPSPHDRSAARKAAADAAPVDQNAAIDRTEDLDASAAAEGTAPERTFAELVRRLAPEPGFWRIVRFADFIDALTPQLAAAQRLQPGHRLACYVQVYEVCARTSLASLEHAAARELGVAGKLAPLSYELCRRFGLSLPRPAFALAATPASNSPGVVFPGARFISLRVALDPTVDAHGAGAPNGGPEQPPPRPAPVAKTAVPEEFGKPWELRHSRDEAVYDMNLEASRGGVRRLFDRLFGGVSSRDMRKWQALLSSKTLDEQLWAVKPPRGAFRDARVRSWLAQALQLGGYDVARMQIEWEIHWRRQAP